MLIDPYAGTWQTRYSSRGFLHQVWQPAMPWINPEFLECTVYLYPSEAEAEDGERIGGSGFLVGIPVELGSRSGNILCVATNKHVIETGNMVVRVNTIDGRRDIIALDSQRWFFHPDGDDLAVCPIQLSAFHKMKCLTPSNFITKETIEWLEIGPGDDVFVVGRFVNHEGKQKNLPSVRFGNISQMPYEPIVVDGYAQESFLIEARSISGYSGSPVFVYLPPAPLPANLNPELVQMIKDKKMKWPGVSEKRIHIPMMMGPFLLGVDYCHIRWDEPIWSKTTGKPVSEDWYVKSNTGMMGVIPAWKLNDIFQGAEMKPLIDAAKAAFERAKKDTKVELDLATFAKSSPPASDENSTHREDFSRLLGVAAKTPPQDD